MRPNVNASGRKCDRQVAIALAWHARTIMRQVMRNVCVVASLAVGIGV